MELCQAGVDTIRAPALPADLPLANHPPEGTPGADSPLWTFDDIARFGELSGLPVVVKGVLRGDDAVRCVQAGAAAVWVSAHGGRLADPIKTVGEHTVPLKLHRQVTVPLTVKVVKEGAQPTA